MMSYEEFKALQEQYEKAEQSDKPYVGAKDDEIHVFGNANKTEKETHTYKVKFAFPKVDEYRGENIIKETDNYLVAVREYKDVFIPARRHASIISAFTEVEALFREVTEDGEVRDLSEEEMRMVLDVISEEMEDRVINAVAKVLRIDEDEKEYMIVPYAMQTIVEIMANAPEILNESDLFFG